MRMRRSDRGASLANGRFRWLRRKRPFHGQLGIYTYADATLTQPTAELAGETALLILPSLSAGWRSSPVNVFILPKFSHI